VAGQPRSTYGGAGKVLRTYVELAAREGNNRQMAVVRNRTRTVTRCPGVRQNRYKPARVLQRRHGPVVASRRTGYEPGTQVVMVAAVIAVW